MDEDGDCEMKRLYLKELFRRKKIGRALTERVLTDAREVGYSAMRLDTLQRIRTARALYAKLGFKVIPAYYSNPLDEVVYMELML